MQAEALNCPNCGGAVSSDKTQCDFCRSRLKTIGCPQCLGLMFQGSRFCDHCGAFAAAVKPFDAENPGLCPRCNVQLHPLQIEASALRGCEKCDGLWVDGSTFEMLCLNKERQAAVLTFAGDAGLVQLQPLSVKYVPCPDCKQLMNRKNFVGTSGVIIDVCKEHGVWLDKNELPQILDFINNGGLDKARAKQKVEIANQLQNLEAAKRRQSAQDIRHGLRLSWQDERESSLKSFLSLFFD